MLAAAASSPSRSRNGSDAHGEGVASAASRAQSIELLNLASAEPKTNLLDQVHASQIQTGTNELNFPSMN